MAGNALRESMPLDSESKMQLVERCRRDADLSVQELWWRCFTLGAMSTPRELDAMLDGTIEPTAHEYNIIASALNAHLAEFDPSRSVPYIEDGVVPT